MEDGSVGSSFLLFQHFLNLRPDGVCQLSHDRTLLRGELAHLLQHCGELALLAQEPNPQILQLGRGLGLLQGFHSLLLDLCQLFFHFLISFTLR